MGTFRKKRLMITGCSGNLGFPLAQLATQNHEVLGLYHNLAISIPGVETLSLDLNSTDELVKLCGDWAPDYVIHCAALSNPNLCEENPELSFQLNVQVSKSLLAACETAQSRLIFTSTDLVFDGLEGNYSEMSRVNPTNVYGQHKRLVEEILLGANGQHWVCRMPLMFGRNPHKESMVDGMLTKLAANESMSLFADEYRSMVSYDVAAKGILQLVSSLDCGWQQNQSLIHLGGCESISRYEFGRQLASVFNFDAGLVLPGRQVDVPMSAHRPPDASMKSLYCSEIGFYPGSVLQQIVDMKSQDS